MLKQQLATLLIIINIITTAGFSPGFKNAESTEEDADSSPFSTILVSTIDGRLRALNTDTGDIKWTLQEEPVLRSPSSVKQGFTFLPNPLDGSLYVLKNSSLKKLPFSIPQIVHASPCKGNDGVLYAGSKKDVWFGIDPVTGAKIETLSSASADRICPANQRQTVFLGRTEYRVSMFDELNRAKTWNATFNDYSAHLLPENNEYFLKHYVSSSQGNILAVDKKTGEIRWEQDLKQPIVALYLLQNDGLHKLPFTVMGRETMENVAKSIYSIDQWPSVLGVDSSGPHTTSIVNSFFMTLYVGESPFGLYALDALVDHQTITYSPKLLGPPLIEGPAPIALTNAEKEELTTPRRPIIRNVPASITHKTIDGEFLLFGYHETPSMTLSVIIPTRYPNFSPTLWSIDDKNSENLKQIAGPSSMSSSVNQKSLIDRQINEGDGSLNDIFMQFYKNHPKKLLSLITTIIILIISVIWMCGRQWGHSTALMNEMMMATAIGETRSAQTSRQSNKGNSFTWMTRKIEIPDGWMAVGSKLLYNPGDILGTGCEGTVVYRGTFDGREVAVKRVVSEFVKFAHREADLLRESDAHPHVIRYFCMESDSQFRYLALELCVSSLNEYVEKDEIRQNVTMSTSEILRQATDGLVHLHASKIVHRDMKPQNVLITMPNQRGTMRIVISDFGLCKRVQPGKNSLSRGIASGLAGTDGWIAPEALISESTSYPVDIFSLGCIFYYVLTKGSHPFGKSLHRQANIVNGSYSLNQLAKDDDLDLSQQLISSMLNADPSKRPTSSAVLNHPLFWNAEKRLAFFSDVSDRIEKEEEQSLVVRRLETDARLIVNGGWREQICEALKEDLRKFRTYKTYSVRDLLRAMRNKKHHYRELPEDVRKSLGDVPEHFLKYFTSRFPKLLLHVYKAIEFCSSEPVFGRYYSDETRDRMKPIVDEEERIRREISLQMQNETWSKVTEVPSTNTKNVAKIAKKSKKKLNSHQIKTINGQQQQQQQQF